MTPLPTVPESEEEGLTTEKGTEADVPTTERSVLPIMPVNLDEEEDDETDHEPLSRRATKIQSGK